MRDNAFKDVQYSRRYIRRFVRIKVFYYRFNFMALDLTEEEDCNSNTSILFENAAKISKLYLYAMPQGHKGSKKSIKNIASYNTFLN